LTLPAPRVSVVIPARDAAPTLARTLDALRAQEFRDAFEVIVVDDGSQDETAAIARRHAPLVSLIQNAQSQGPGSARNRGVHVARAPVLAFTDADCFPSPSWLAAGCEALAHADLVQGRVDPDPAAARSPFDRSLSVERHRGFYQTANLLVRREAFEAIGGFRDWALEQPGRRRWSVDRRRARATRTPIGEDTLFAWSGERLGLRTTFAADALVAHAVVPGDVRDAIADRWHWTRDMPGLARHVPELRSTVFYRSWFFADWTAKFDVALVGIAAAAITRRRLPLLVAAPYVRHVWRDAQQYRNGAGSRGSRMSRVAAHALGAPIVDAATLGGLAIGSAAWRCLVL
jgi:glycosyltransferase involved in cell wall biosynthesis